MVVNGTYGRMTDGCQPEKACEPSGTSFELRFTKDRTAPTVIKLLVRVRSARVSQLLPG